MLPKGLTLKEKNRNSGSFLLMSTIHFSKIFSQLFLNNSSRSDP